MGTSFIRVSLGQYCATSRGRTTCLKKSQYSLGSQFAKVRLVDTETAEDLGIVLAERGGDIAYHYPLADPDRRADARDFAQFRIARILHESTAAHLRSANICA
jgi:hypothetical protein